MKNAPIIVICGKAGSGKDTVASIIKELVPRTSTIAFSDPLKEFGAELFGFSAEQLYGPSQNRNAIDERYNFRAMWDKMRDHSKIVIDTFVDRHDLTDFEEYTQDSLNIWLDILEKETIGAGKGLSPRVFLQYFGSWGRNIDLDLWSDIAFGKTDDLLYTKKEADLVLVTDCRYKSEMCQARSYSALLLLVKSVSNVTFNHSSETELDTVPKYWYDYVINNDKSLGVNTLRTKVVQYLTENGIL